MSNKFLSILVVVLLGLLLTGGGLFAWKNFSKPPESGKEDEEKTEKETVKELTLEERPFTTLTPGPSCEYTLALDQIQKDPEKIEYEIVYKDEKGVTQGATGTLKPEGKSNISKKVLFGSESSGHRKCDKGTEEGTITLRYRNSSGKLLTKLDTEFTIKEGGKTISLGDNLKATLEKNSTSKLLAMSTFGLPAKAPGKATGDPFAILTNGPNKQNATIKLKGSGKPYGWNGKKWVEIQNEEANFLGTYILIE